MDVKLTLEILFSVFGGLGIFLLGMRNMSEGMQQVAGQKLRKLINAITNNRFLACGVGTVVTSVIQSSSVTTVMVVGMVNASLMTLKQAIGVILGANIGTTITAWILVLKIGKYGLPIIGIAALFYLFAKKDRIRFTATVFLGLGMIFFGLELMKDGFAPLRDMPGFIKWFSAFSPTSYFGVLKTVAVGAILTAIVQSSSATIGITIGLASTGIIDYQTAAALVLGENIGTTITAYLASIGASTNAKRASYAHMVVNVLGVVWITAIFAIYIKFIMWFIGHDPNATQYTDAGTIYPYAERAIATTHSVFNIANVIVFLPFVGILSRLLIKMIPEKHKEVSHLTYIDVRMVDTPSFAIQQSQKELMLMARSNEKMMDMLRKVMAGKGNGDIENKIFNRENILDVVQKEITEFLSNILTANVSHDVVKDGRVQMRMADEYESISDYIISILKLYKKMIKSDLDFSPDAQAEVLQLHDSVSGYLKFINDAVEEENSDILNKAMTEGQAVTYLMKDLRSKHLERVSQDKVTPLKSLIYTDMLNNYRKIKDHTFNIAEALAGEK